VALGTLFATLGFGQAPGEKQTPELSEADIGPVSFFNMAECGNTYVIVSMYDDFDDTRIDVNHVAKSSFFPGPGLSLDIHGDWKEAVGNFLEDLGQKIVPLDIAYGNELWDFYTTGERGKLDELEAQQIALYSDKETFETLKALRCLKQLDEEPLLKWRVERQYRDFLEYQGEKDFLEALKKLENDTHAILIEHRAALDGEEKTNEQLRDVLRYSADRAERERAWRALYAVGEKMAEGVRSLVEKRNKHARRLGYRSFYEMKFELNDLDAGEIEKLLKRLDRLSRKPYRKYLEDRKAALGVERLEPWDMRYDPERVEEEMKEFFPKAALETRIKDTYRKMGFDIDALGILCDLEPRPNKSQHAYSFAVDAPRDVRILANLNDGFLTAHTLFHEFGHAVYSKHVPAEPWDMRDDAGGPMTEGMGQFFGRVVEDERWLRDVAGAHARKKNLYRLRFSLALLRFERAMFESPGRDLNELWWDLIEKYAGVARRDEVFPWGSIVHFTTHPVYLQNYLLADMICDSLWEHVEENAGGVVGSAQLAPYLNETFFRHGAAMPWQKLYRKALGKKLSADAYIRYRLGE
jgi:peptidyl-dipeptidase A